MKKRYLERVSSINSDDEKTYRSLIPGQIYKEWSSIGNKIYGWEDFADEWQRKEKQKMYKSLFLQQPAGKIVHRIPHRQETDRYHCDKYQQYIRCMNTYRIGIDHETATAAT